MTMTNKQRSIIGYAIFAVIIAAIGAMGVLTYMNRSALAALANDRHLSYEALSSLDTMLSKLDALEVAEANASAALDEPNVTQYQAAVQEMRQQSTAVRDLLAGHPGQQTMLAVFEPLIVQRLDHSRQTIDAVQGSSAKDTSDLLSGTRGKQLTDTIRRSVTDMKNVEYALIAQYDNSVSWQQRHTVIILGAGNLLFLIAFLAYVLFMRNQKALHQSARDTLMKLIIAVEQSSDLVVVTDKSGTIEFVNKAVERISGYANTELLGKTREIWRSGKHGEKFFTEMRDTVFAGLPFSGLSIYRAKNGTLFYLEETVTPFRDDGGIITHLISTGKDVTHQKNLNEKVNYLSRFDVLTGMPNRVFFTELLEQGIIKMRQSGALIAVLVLDIDRFKLVNDTFGFSAGNDILRAITERLTFTVGGGGSVARIGNDEFGIALQNMAGLQDIRIAVDRIMSNVREPIMLRGEEIVLSLSVGISVYPEDGSNAETLLGNAHIALSKAKSEGRHSYQFFTHDITRQASESMLLEKHLNAALKNDEYLVHYQPYLDMTTKRVGGVEALIKWKSGKHGMVSPSKFIPLLEDSGMIIDVGEWVLRTACRQIKLWDREPAKFPVAVNLSLMQLRHKDIIKMVERAIHEFDIDPARLTLEVTEGMCIYDLDFASMILKKLKDLGVSISIDDFGTGYSSLSYLKKLPADNVKIDMSFVKDITIDPDAASIVSAITTLARSLNLKTIAEGVETRDQWKILRLLRCDMAQGYLFSPAVPAPEISLFASQSR